MKKTNTPNAIRSAANSKTQVKISLEREPSLASLLTNLVLVSCVDDVVQYIAVNNWFVVQYTLCDICIGLPIVCFCLVTRLSLLG